MSIQPRTEDSAVSQGGAPSAERPSTGPSPASRWTSARATFETLLIVGALLAHLTLTDHNIYADGQRRFNELTELLTQGQLSGDKYSLIGPLFATPLWLLGNIYRTPEWWVGHFNLVFFSLCIAAIYWLLKDRVDRGLVRIFLLILILASLFPPALSSFYGETFTAMGVGVGILAAVFGPRILGWAATALGVANTPATLLGLAFVAVVRMFQIKRIWPVLALAAAGGLIVGENLLRFHHLTNTRYESGFTFPLFLGILSILFSFGKGLIFFTPGLVLPLRRRLFGMGPGGIQLYRAYMLWIAFTVGLVLVYAHWYDWSGDWFFGPRFFLFASLPASLALATYVRRPSDSLRVNLVVLLILSLSAWVGITAVLFNLTALAGPCGVLPNGVCEYLPQSSALWFPLVDPHVAPGIKPLIYTAFAALVFLYLAVPLVVTIAHQTRTVLQREWMDWRFGSRMTFKLPILPRFPRDLRDHSQDTPAQTQSQRRP